MNLRTIIPTVGKFAASCLVFAVLLAVNNAAAQTYPPASNQGINGLPIVSGLYSSSSTIVQTVNHPGPIVVDCVGDSITAGVGASSSQNNYPSLLRDLLGPNYNVINFGESGATLLKNGDSPYWQRGGFAKSAAAAPDVVIIMLGTNDSKPWNWTKSDQFAGDYAALIDYYSALPSHPQIFAVLPPPVPGKGNYGINEPNVEMEVPLITQVALQKSVPIIDVHSGIPNDSHFFADNVHPNDTGYIQLASVIYEELTQAPVIEPIANRDFANATGDGFITIDRPAPNVLVRYTLDGRPVTRRSPTYGGAIHIGDPLSEGGTRTTETVTVTARAFQGNRQVGLPSVAAFEVSDILRGAVVIGQPTNNAPPSTGGTVTPPTN